MNMKWKYYIDHQVKFYDDIFKLWILLYKTSELNMWSDGECSLSFPPKMVYLNFENKRYKKMETMKQVKYLERLIMDI